jgi:hypothetical protein
MTAQIQEIVNIGYTPETAQEIEDVINSQWLLDWSECTTREFKAAVKIAAAFIANGKSWE